MTQSLQETVYAAAGTALHGSRYCIPSTRFIIVNQWHALPCSADPLLALDSDFGAGRRATRRHAVGHGGQPMRWSGLVTERTAVIRGGGGACWCTVGGQDGAVGGARCLNVTCVQCENGKSISTIDSAQTTMAHDADTDSDLARTPDGKHPSAQHATPAMLLWSATRRHNTGHVVAHGSQ